MGMEHLANSDPEKVFAKSLVSDLKLSEGCLLESSTVIKA